MFHHPLSVEEGGNALFSCVWHGSLTKIKTFHAFTHYPCAVFYAIESAALNNSLLIFIQETGYKRSHTAQLNQEGTPEELQHFAQF